MVFFSELYAVSHEMYEIRNKNQLLPLPREWLRYNLISLFSFFKQCENSTFSFLMKHAFFNLISTSSLWFHFVMLSLEIYHFFFAEMEKNIRLQKIPKKISCRTLYRSNSKKKWCWKMWCWRFLWNYQPKAFRQYDIFQSLNFQRNCGFVVYTKMFEQNSMTFSDWPTYV